MIGYFQIDHRSSINRLNNENNEFVLLKILYFLWFSTHKNLVKWKDAYWQKKSKPIPSSKLIILKLSPNFQGYLLFRLMDIVSQPRRSTSNHFSLQDFLIGWIHLIRGLSPFHGRHHHHFEAILVVDHIQQHGLHP